MQTTSLSALADELLEAAAHESSGRASRTIHGGHEHALRQTMIALAAGERLQEHENPGEATLQVVRGRVRLDAGADAVELGQGEYIVIPPTRHALEALDPSVVLLTTALTEAVTGRSRP